MTAFRQPARAISIAFLTGLLASAAAGQVAPRHPRAVAEKLVRHPDLTIPGRYLRVAELPPSAGAAALSRLESLGVAPSAAFVDPRTGRWGTLLSSRPLVPGTGAGNTLTWSDLGGPAPRTEMELGGAAWKALRAYLGERRQAFEIAPEELSAEPRVTVHDDGDLIQIFASRLVRGLPVRDSYLTAVVSRGNLVLLGFRNWGSIEVAAAPAVPLERAEAALRAHLSPLAVDGHRGRPELAFVPLAAGPPQRFPVGRGLAHRLAWVLRPTIAESPASWEALVDAATGELLSFRDTHLYATPRSVAGGVYPESNDGVSPGGLEQAGYPMPHADVASSAGLAYADGGGNLPICVDGTIDTALDGRFVEVADVCGPVAETSSGDLDLGTGPGTDCAVPAGGSAGNTHATRTAYYHLNRVRELALGQLPGNGWMQSQLPSLVNFPSALLSCNAFWDGFGIVLFTEDPTLPPTGCANTGELAGVIAHEWAHGLDDNDANGLISNPAEGIADVVTALYLNDSCIGRGFFQGTPCDPGDGDPCTVCDGAREIDWALRSSGQPHDIAFIDASCPAGIGDPGPCGGAIHCEGAVVSEAAWDLWNRDLPAAGHDAESAREIATRLFHLGSGTVGAWFQCTPGGGTGDGCNADGGYLGLLAADDDNGDLTDGTPHMAAIHAAFDRHGIACATPTVQSVGCAGAPAAAPVASATELARGVELSWSAVPGAARYVVVRGEGVLGCAGGKARVAETTGTTWIDEGLRNGLEYAYTVIPVGDGGSCLGPASACVTATPAAGPNLGVDADAATLTPLTGDGDAVVDNCETARLTFDLHNIGAGTLTNAQLLDVEVLSHPATVTVTTPMPQPLATPLDACGVATGSFDFAAQGLAHNDTLEFLVRVTADELGGRARSAVLRLEGAESDLVPFASKTFSFETDLEGWQVVQGTFVQTAGTGAQSSGGFVASSANLPDQCDQIRSPPMRLSPTSTVTLSNLFDIEPALDLLGLIFWFDRANLALYNPATGVREPLDPDSGRPYNAAGSDGSCVTEGQNGWADSMPTWASSGWSAAALGDAAAAARVVQLDLAYGTDTAEEGFGFHFDEVTVTDVELLVADAYPDLCSTANGAPDAVDDAETPTHLDDVTVAVLANDTDPDPGDALRVSAVVQPGNGTASIDDVGPGLDTVTYSAAPCFTGVDTFDYTAADSFGATDTATVTIDRTGLAGHAALDLVLGGQTVTSGDRFRGCNTLSAGNGFHVDAPAETVSLEAGSEVVLENDLSVGTGSEVEITLDPALLPPP